jgi:hypothetical protein
MLVLGSEVEVNLFPAQPNTIAMDDGKVNQPAQKLRPRGTTYSPDSLKLTLVHGDIIVVTDHDLNVSYSTCGTRKFLLIEYFLVPLGTEGLIYDR